MTDVPTFSIRPAKREDEAFLYSSFLKSFRESDLVAGVGNDDYYRIFSEQFALVLWRFKVLVAHPEGDEDEIAGWLAHKGDVVAWVYVKRDPWRKMGVARRLWMAAGLPDEVRALYGSRWALERAHEKGLGVRYVPHVEATLLLNGVR